MKHLYLFAALALAVTASAEEPATRALAWEAPEFVEADWTLLGNGQLHPGVLDYLGNEYPNPLKTTVWSSKVNAGDYWVEADVEGISMEEYCFPGPFIVHAQNPDKVYTDPIWYIHPLIFCFAQNVPEIMGISGSDAAYGRLAEGTFTFPAANYLLVTLPTGTPVSNVNGTFSFTLPDAAGIETLEEENAAAEYYTLSGVRVAEPQQGIYIVRRGAKTQKVILR